MRLTFITRNPWHDKRLTLVHYGVLFFAQWAFAFHRNVILFPAKHTV